MPFGFDYILWPLFWQNVRERSGLCPHSTDHRGIWPSLLLDRTHEHLNKHAMRNGSHANHSVFHVFVSVTYPSPPHWNGQLPEQEQQGTHTASRLELESSGRGFWPLWLPWIPFSKCRRMTRTSVQFLFPVMSEEWKWKHSNVSLNWNGWQSLWPGKKKKGLAGEPLASSFVTSLRTAGRQRGEKAWTWGQSQPEQHRFETTF